MFKKVLIANRGEIALRIAKTLKNMGVGTVGIYDERERNSASVSICDEAYSLGFGDIAGTFLNIDKIIDIAKHSGAEAIHPGYGFLSENASFAERCRKENVVFIGPEPATIELMGNKLRALALAKENNVPVIPGLYGTQQEIAAHADENIFPCLVKASAGGGGKGMRLAHSKEELIDLLGKTALEAKRYFADDSVFIEKYLENPRHIEVQILSDSYGNHIHLFERECTVQRRYQKVIEESPATSINNEIKERLYADALKIAKAVNYRNAGTVEFLVDSSGNHYFLEMNTRIQVEHPVTEAITGIDIVEQQVRIANGEKLPEQLTNIKPQGHAIEVRLYAEDPLMNFRPSPGKVTLAAFSSELARYDSALEAGDTIEMDFDPMLAKIIVSGVSRNKAVQNMQSALSQTHVHGIVTNREFLLAILRNRNFQTNQLSTHFIQDNQVELLKGTAGAEFDPEMLLVALCISLDFKDNALIRSNSLANFLGHWRMQATIQLMVNDTVVLFDAIKKEDQAISARFNNSLHKLEFKKDASEFIVLNSNGKRNFRYSWNIDSMLLTISDSHQTWKISREGWLYTHASKALNQLPQTNGFMQLKAPLSGQVVRINYKVGDRINEGESILAIESMKMENELRLPGNAKLNKLYVKPGTQVSEGDILMELHLD